MAVFACVPYVLASWGCAKFSEVGFWPALGGIVAIRLLFGIVETLGSALAWHLYGKNQMIERNLSMLRSNNYPKRRFAHDDFLNYLSRLEEDDACPQQIKIAAKQWEQALAFFEGSGILLGMRMHAAADDALNIYSPKLDAPVFGATVA